MTDIQPSGSQHFGPFTSVPEVVYFITMEAMTTAPATKLATKICPCHHVRMVSRSKDCTSTAVWQSSEVTAQAELNNGPTQCHDSTQVHNRKLSLERKSAEANPV